MRLFLAASVAVALLAALPAGSATRPKPAALIAKGIARSQLTPSEKTQYLAVLGRARTDLKRLPELRADVLRTVVADVAAQWRSYTTDRALVLFSTLEVNADWLEHHAAWASHPDLDRRRRNRLPLVLVARLRLPPARELRQADLEAAAGNAEATERHAAALLLRATPVAGKLVWQYEFPFASGRAPWASGMAQAVASQALVRAGNLLGDPALLDAADRAYASLAGLLSGSSRPSRGSRSTASTAHPSSMRSSRRRCRSATTRRSRATLMLRPLPSA